MFSGRRDEAGTLQRSLKLLSSLGCAPRPLYFSCWCRIPENWELRILGWFVFPFSLLFFFFLFFTFGVVEVGERQLFRPGRGDLRLRERLEGAQVAEVFKKLNPGGGRSGCLTPVDRDPGSQG